jgi:hypothetical protein
MIKAQNLMCHFRKKIDPTAAVKEMRRQFAPEAWLSESQVQSFFSKLTAEVRRR